MGMPLREARSISQENTGINTIEFIQGRATVHAVNNIRHLARLQLHAA